MSGAALSAELLNRVMCFASNRRSDLLSFCLVSKAFQREAEGKLYSAMVFHDPRTAQLAFRTLIQSERLALLVRTFCFNYETSSRRPSPPLPRTFWEELQEAFQNMRNTEVLILSDPSCQNSWIFDHPKLQMQLREFRVRLAVDDHVLRFLENQPRLRYIQLLEYSDFPSTLTLDGSELTDLRIFDGTITIASQLFACSPLVSTQFYFDQKPDISLALLRKISGVSKTLRSISILDLPEILTLPVLDIITRSCPNLRHIGQFFLPILNRHLLLEYLMRLAYIRSLDIDLSHFSPMPVGPAQRVLAAELKTFCPAMKQIVFWVHNTRTRWNYVGENWVHHTEQYRYRPNNGSWMNV